MPKEPVGYVNDDDDDVRDSVCMLLDSYGIGARLYVSGAALLADPLPDQGRLLVDVEMAGVNGVELVDQVRRRGIAMPVIVMTGRPTISPQIAVDRASASLLQKPFRSGELMACIKPALG